MSERTEIILLLLFILLALGFAGSEDYQAALRLDNESVVRAVASNQSRIDEGLLRYYTERAR